MNACIHDISINVVRIPGMCDTLVILNLHDLKGIPIIRKWMSGRHIAAEDRSLCAVTHLALLGVKIQEPAFWV